VTLPRVVLVTGTGTGVGKTVVTAAVAARARAAGRSVAVVKPVQTGGSGDEPTDVAEVCRLAAPAAALELLRLPEPLAPQAAARRAGVRLPPLSGHARRIVDLAAGHDLVLVEGAGGLLVRLDADGGTLADLGRLVAAQTSVGVLVVVAAGLGTLNHAELTVEALRRRGLPTLGLVIGSWPAEPGVAEQGNLGVLPLLTGVALLGVLPARASRLSPDAFTRAAGEWLAPLLGGDRH